MNYELSVICPCYNESKNIPELIGRLENVFNKKNVNGEIVIVNDGSQDDTGKIADKFAAKFSNIKVLHHRKNKGIEASWKTGLSSSEGEYVCLIDADLQYLPEDVWRLYREIQITRADMVQGFRSSIGRNKDFRFYLSRGLNFLLNHFFGMKQEDNKSGFVICRKEVLEDILYHRFNYNYYQSFIAVAAKMKGYTIREVETLFQERLLGKSFVTKFPIKIVFGVLSDLVKGLVEFRFLNKKEGILSKFLSQNPPKKYEETLEGWRKWLFKIYIALMPLHHWMISYEAGDYYHELKRSQWLSQEKIKELQEKKLQKIINHAYYHVSYYREIMDNLGLKPSDIQTVDDLKKLPLLTKDDIRENLYFDLMSDNHDKKKILKITTSGSTGEPLVFYVDKYQLEMRWAATLRSMEWTGYRFGDKQARLWHQTIGMSLTQIIKERIDALFNRRLFIPAFEMSDENILRFFKKLQKYKPVLIDGYAESFNFLAHYLKTRGGNIEGINPKGIISSAQELPDQSREIIEKQFGCHVFDKYGSREFSGIAYECEAHDGHHVVAENYIVEILKDGVPAKPGEIGEVVITDLNNYCMPFIRYRIGDVAVAMDNNTPCKCGRGLPKIGKIEGRVQAIIIGTNGNYLPGTFFAHFFKDYDYIIRQYQVLQEELGKIRLKIVKAPRFDSGIFKKMLSELHKYLGKNMVIGVEFVDRIPMVRTGKHQGSISKIKLDFQNLNFKKNKLKKRN